MSPSRPRLSHRAGEGVAQDQAGPVVERLVLGGPAAALAGEELRSCLAKGLGSDILTYRFAGPPTVPTSCDMAGGSSGGAWIVGGEYIDGVTSYGYTGFGNKVYSPYFGSEVGNFLSKLP